MMTIARPRLAALAAAVAAFAAAFPALSQDDADQDGPSLPPALELRVPAPAFGDLAPLDSALLSSPSSMGGTCTCSVTEPPASGIDCDAAASQMRANADAQAREMVNACVSDTLDRCEAQEGPRACAALPAALRGTCDPVAQGRLACAAYSDQIKQQCQGAVDASMQRDFTPAFNQQIAACRAQSREVLQPWYNWCENVAKPQACGVCDAEASDIAAIETEIAELEARVEEKRNGVIGLNEDPNAIPDRLDRIRSLESRLAQKRENLSLMQETGYCP